MESVKLYETNLTLPAYKMREDYKEPAFCGHGLNNRSVYPYTYQGNLTRIKATKTFRALIIENKYLKITMLPQLGGRIYSVFDKKKNEEMFYNPGAIKPALIAIRGAWICGGVEFNSAIIGHSVTTMSPLNCLRVEKSAAGASVTVGDIERNFRTEWQAKITLRPNKPFFETEIKINNPTPFPAPSYFWTNTALPCNDYVQIFYPAKKIRIGWAGKIDFPFNHGIDMSWIRNYIHPSDTYALGIEKDWFAVYDHQREAGVVNVADRRKCRGRKIFTWGRSDDNNTWKDRLSEDHTLYIEMQSGMFETQHETGLIRPGQTISWKEKWYPFWGAPKPIVREMQNYYIKAMKRARKKKKMPAPKPPARKKIDLFEEGVKDYRLGCDGDAEAKFRKALRKDPKNPAQLLLWLGIIYLKQGLFKKAKNMFKACLQKDRSNKEAKHYLCQISVKKVSKGRFLWNDPKDLCAPGIDPSAELYLELASRRLNAKEYSMARYLLLEYVMKCGTKIGVNPMAYYYLGSITDNKDAALVYYELAEKMKSDFVFPHRTEEIEILRKACKTAGPKCRMARYYLGSLLYSKGRPEEALKEWKTSEKLGNNDPVLLRNIGYALWRWKGNKSEAKRYYRRALSLGGGTGLQTFDEFDDLCRTTKDRKVALKILNSVPIALKNNEFIRKRLARWYLKKDPDKAIELLNEKTFYFPSEGERTVANLLQRAYFNKLKSTVHGP
ncbi:hypothetical protein COY52_05555 [Candidatus Desantisbacteria bacterium CG_4_10_14_0_8_um_filter_48_22]|uniref:DUF5107 domain-containing protein n=1 Tax=Candidatus Desantisbacteria bacterium CG_4_10_14_0_8_um_filter_48_22 TaxID=1974543 RepID=A0A2M7SBS7_9BACT|nr:MAG: hypothetical protein AUJ67_08895 [Candidatus Desantisbacteria bacterium CG1_02_49_89]PIV54762.1 MAG: hypothetical protein COS16_09285 [Candidatus Desantisbacteria bacterium CG02_land_8_20_14_3_00_49_13]PIZ16997.1 MAG: hypothetical protein COY52_05555 [Candidatus Desantisbacteria bacterium CG_4_10_14_0_8_um_filter_48_22]PJB28263.1 MAG: hypothetical protein CO111_02070 [Candidatus Desantisbacteria bacterium CG_4_9_14_3_um_filter_50_7]